MVSRRFVASAFAATAILCCVAVCTGAVIGIDFGSEFIKVAIVKPGKPFHIVIDETAKRKIPAMVAFDGDERMFGTAAQGVMYAYMHTILGKPLDSPAVEAIRKLHYPYEFVGVDARTAPAVDGAAADDDSKPAPVSPMVGLKHSSDVTWQPEDLLAMNFQHIKKISEIDAESPVKDCVITVPPFFAQAERQALIDAAELAGLNVLALINENTAAAVQYGIDRTYTNDDIIASADAGHSVLIYNMGTTSTKVSLVGYSAYNQTVTKKTSKIVGQMEVKAVAFDDLLGGRDFDGRLVDHFASEFTAQLKKKGDNSNIYKMPRVMAKFREAANKAKTVLSANVDTLVAIAGVFEEYDFKMVVTRDKFLELCKDLIERSIKPVEQVLTESGVAAAKISRIIIIGGGTRVPAIQSALKSFLKRDQLDMNLNADEAAAMGAAFIAANMSTAFRVRPFGMTDVTAFPVGVRLANLPAPEDSKLVLSEEDKNFSKRAVLFSRYNKLEKRKTVAFSHRSDISVAMHYDSPSKYLPKGVRPAICVYNVTGISALAGDAAMAPLLATQKPRLSLKFVVDASGLTDLVRAEATVEEMVKVVIEKVNNTATANATDAAADDKKADGDAAEKKADDAAAPLAAEADAEAESPKAAAADKDIQTETNADGVEVQYKLKKKTHRFVLSVTKAAAPGTVAPLNSAQKAGVRALLAKLAKADERKAEIAAAKNSVEAFIYGTRTRLYEDEVVQSVTTEAQREAAIAELSAAEDWLSGAPSNDGPEPFNAKLEELKKASAPIFFRAEEVKERASAINSTQAIANYTRTLLTKIEKTMPWIKEADRTELTEALESVESWLATKQAEQEKTEPHDTPAFTSEQLLDKLRPIARLGQALLKKKKPVEKKPKVSVKDSNGTSAANHTTTATEEGEAAATDAEASTESATPEAAADSTTESASSESTPPPPPPEPPVHNTEL